MNQDNKTDLLEILIILAMFLLIVVIYVPVAIWEDAVRKEFEISKNYSLLCGICLGYPSDEKINSFNANRPKPSEIIFPEKG